MGKLLNGEECQILLDMGASKSYMSKSYYLRCKSLHNLPKFASKTQRIQVRNGQYVGVLFVIMVIVEINGHRLEVFMLVSEIFDNVDMLLGIKNLFELEGVIDSRESSFRFLSRSIPIFGVVRVWMDEVLGVWIDEVLSFKYHVKMKCKSAMFNLVWIKRLRPSLTVEAANILVMGLVISHLDYANSILIGVPDVTIKQLQHVQNIAAKVVLQADKYASPKECMKKSALASSVQES